MTAPRPGPVVQSDDASPSLLDAALKAHAAGISVVPPMEDGSKRPLAEFMTRERLEQLVGKPAADEIIDDPSAKGKSTWKHWTKVRPSLGQLHRWYGEERRTGIGLVGGAVSGNLEVMDFDDRETYAAFGEAARAAGLDDLLERIARGFEERSPQGTHLLYRCSTISGNTKLAQRPRRPEEMGHPNDRVKVLIETRGEAGYIIVAPTSGPVHPSGQPYRLVRGSVATIAEITPGERTALWRLAQAFDQMPKTEDPPPRFAAGEGRPGDDFNKRASWPDVLKPHGWIDVFQRNAVGFWRRPGKQVGVSATTNYAGTDLLYVFSTSTPLTAERAYTKFSAYAILSHGGDFRAAAAALAAQGYGAMALRAGRRPGMSTASQWPDPGLENPITLWAPRVHLSPAELDHVQSMPTWVRDYVAYAMLRTDAPSVFHKAVGLALLSVAVGRSAALHLTTGLVLANLWIMLVADSTRYRKSTSLDLGDGILERAGLDVLAPDDFTPQRFIGLMAERSGRPTLFRRDEFGGFYGGLNKLDHQTGGKQTLITFYDGRDYEKQLVGAQQRQADGSHQRVPEKIVVRDPFLSIIAGTQYELFLEQAESGDIANGFLPRFSFVVPVERPKRRDIGLLAPDTETLADHLARRLREIAGRPQRNVRVAPGVLERWNAYQAATEDEAEQAPVPSIAEPVFARASFSALKIALVLAAAEGEVIELRHLLAGIRQAEVWRASSYRLLCAIGPSKDEKRLMKAMEHIRRKPGCQRGEVMAAQRLSARDMDAIEQTLDQRGWISLQTEGKGRRYWPRATGQEGILANLESLHRPILAPQPAREEHGPIEDEVPTVQSSQYITQNNNTARTRERGLIKDSRIARIPAEVPSEAARRACSVCGSNQWWQRSDGAWLCSTCHPNPNGSVVAAAPRDADEEELW